MPRAVLYALVFVLAAVAGYFAYGAFQRDRNTLEIQVGPNGVKVEPPGR